MLMVGRSSHEGAGERERERERQRERETGRRGDSVIPVRAANMIIIRRSFF
jgi:hypothetical protein